MKLFERITICAALCVAPLSAAALTVETQAGGLRNAVPNPSEETSLTVTGSLDVTDFDFLREMTSLESLDLSGVTIAPYQGRKSETGQTSSPAGVLPYCALMSGNFSTLVLPAGLTEIADGALGNTRVRQLVIPSTVTRIATGAFSGMTALETITLPASVREIGNMVFKDCKALKTVVIEAPLTALPASSFQGCESLTSVKLPASLTSVGARAFAGCTALTSVDFPASLTSVGDEAFSHSGLTAADLSGCEGLTSVGDWAFANCGSLRTVALPGSVGALGVGAFFKDAAIDASLAQLLPEGTDTVADYLLYGTSVNPEDIGDTSLETVGKYALSGLSAQKITLPATLKMLDDNAMERWTVEHIDATALQEAPPLGTSVWEGVDQPQVTLLVGVGQGDYYKELPQWQDFNVVALSGTDAPTIDNDAEANTGLTAAFDGTVLHLAASVDIRAAQLYDVSGRCFTIAQNFQSPTMQVDTAPYDARVFIVRVLLADGSTPVLKLVR